MTTCLDRLCQAEGAIGYLVQGQYFDTGMPAFYRQALIDFPLSYRNTEKSTKFLYE